MPFKPWDALFQSIIHFKYRIMICISDFVAITVATNTSNLNYLQLIDSAKRHGLNYKVIFQALLARAIELKGTLAYRQKYLTLSLNKGQKKIKTWSESFQWSK